MTSNAKETDPRRQTSWSSAHCRRMAEIAGAHRAAEANDLALLAAVDAELHRRRCAEEIGLTRRCATCNAVYRGVYCPRGHAGPLARSEAA